MKRRFIKNSIIDKWMLMTREERRLSDIASKKGNLRRKEKLIQTIRSEYKKVHNDFQKKQ